MNAVKTLVEEFNNGAISNFIILAFALLFASQEIFKIKDWFCERFGIKTKKSIRNEEEAAMLLAHDNGLLAHDNDLTTIKQEIRGTHEKINILARMLVEMQEKNDSSERARLKDRIAQGYRLYHERKYWTKMEKEAFDGLISDYELHGGENSFVHDICEPESYTWNIIDK